jgi:hypothetical protein
MTLAIRSAQARPVVSPSMKRFPGTVTDAGWSRGDGVRLEPPPGFYVDVLVNPLTKTSAHAHLDSATQSVIVTLRGKMGRPNQMRDESRTLHLGIPHGVKMFHPYTLVVKNAGGHVLKRASVRTMLAE